MAATSLYDRGHTSLTWWAHLRTSALEATGAGASLFAAGLSAGPTCTAPGALNPLERQVAQHQTALRVETSVLSLDVDQRRVVFARYVRGLSVAEAARQLGLDDHEARSILRKAVEIVARDLKFAEIQAKKRRNAVRALRNPQVGLDGVAKKVQDSLNLQKSRPPAPRRHPAASPA